MPLTDHISKRYTKKKNNNIIEYNNKKKQDVKGKETKEEKKEKKEKLDDEPKTQGVPLDNESDYTDSSDSDSDSEYEEILIANLKNLKPLKMERQESDVNKKPEVKKLENPPETPSEELTKTTEIKSKPKKKKPRKIIKKYYINTKHETKSEPKKQEHVKPAPPIMRDSYVNFGKPIKHSTSLRNKILNF